jgi:UDP-glucose 4-epimerase
MQHVIAETNETVNLFNIGVGDVISVKEIVAIILKKMRLKNTKILYAQTTYGWVGDVTQCRLDIKKLSKIGFTPTYSSKEAVELTVDSLLDDVGYGK